MSSNYIRKNQFSSLTIGQPVVIRYMLGSAEVAGVPVVGEESHTMDIKFHTGPWAGKTLNLIRQQIVKVK